MKKSVIIVILIMLSSCVFAQDTENKTGYIFPGDNFENSFSDTLMYMPIKKVDSILKMETRCDIIKRKMLLFKEKIANLEERRFLCDSAIAIKKAEADFWHQKLMNNDIKLEEYRIKNLELIDQNNRIRKSRIYFILAGIVASSIVYIAVK